ncbi:MAG: hypothetical protein IJH65_03730 [Methanobrevibacter sp.]|nr:hypothetical protein [Methanobrevibacter sp.]
MPNINITSIVTMLHDFIDNSDDEEAVELVSTLYLMVLELSGEVGRLSLQNRLLLRELDDELDDEDDFSQDTKNDYVA